MSRADNAGFKFLSSSNSHGKVVEHPNAFRNVPQASPNPKSRVRVQQGDKCVAPGKSKPKKRKNLAPPDGNGLSMDCVEWSSTTYSVRQTVAQFGMRFPVIARVSEGYHVGEAGIDFSIGQVLQVHCYSDQERVKARTAKGRLLSIPLTRQIEVLVTERHTNETLELEDALRRFPLPVQVEVHNVNENAHGSLLNLVGDELHIIEKYEDLYLRANVITDGWIDQANVLVIPSFLEVQLEVALDMHGATEAEWDDYCKMFSRSVRHLNFKQVPGYSGAVSLDVSNPRDSSEVRVDLLPITENNVYQNSSREKVTRNVFTNRAYTPHGNGDDENKPISPVSPLLHSSARPDELYQNVRMASPKLPPKQKHLPPRKETKLPMTSPKPKSSGRHNGHYSKSLNSHGVVDSVDELDVTEMFDGVIQVAEEEDRKRTLEAERNKKNRSYTNTYPEPTASSGYSHYDNHIPKNTSGPFVVSVEVCNTIDRDNRRNRDASKSSTDERKRFHSIEDVPEDLYNLSVEDVCECLELLNMGTHTQDFKQHNVDGKKLKGIKDKALQKDYGLNPFNASKLTRFVRGWRPNNS